MATLSFAAVLAMVSMLEGGGAVKGTGCKPPQRSLVGAAGVPLATGATPTPTPAEIAKIKASFTAHVRDDSSATAAEAATWASNLTAEGAW